MSGNKRYKSDKFQILSKYLTLEIKPQEGVVLPPSEAENFYLEIFSTLPQEKPEISKVSNEKKIAQSPFRSIFHKKTPKVEKISEPLSLDPIPIAQSETLKILENPPKESSSIQKYSAPLEDQRLPKLLLENSLLVCDKHNNIKLLPPPENENMILKSDCNHEFEWVPSESNN